MEGVPGPWKVTLGHGRGWNEMVPSKPNQPGIPCALPQLISFPPLALPTLQTRQPRHKSSGAGMYRRQTQSCRH